MSYERVAGDWDGPDAPDASVDDTKTVLAAGSADMLQYAAFLSLGLSLLWPWNCLLSASQYYQDKFHATPALASGYSPTMMTISTVTSVAANSYLSTVQSDSLVRRVYVGSGANMAVFLVLALAEGLFGPTGAGYFVLLMLLICLSAVGTAVQQTGAMALANVLGPIYAQAVMVGQAVAGVLPAVSLIATNLATAAPGGGPTPGGAPGGTPGGPGSPAPRPGSRTSIVIYFLTTSAVVGASLLLFRLSTPARDAAPRAHHTQQYVPFRQLFRKLRYLVLTIFTTLLVTLVFPIFAANVTSASSRLPDTLFVPLAFLVWNLGDLLGRLAAGYVQLSSDRALLAYSVLRSLLVPLFFLCNVPGRPKRGAAADVLYLLLQLAFGATNGHCLSCAFMSVSSYVDSNDEKEAAGAFTTMFASLGLAAGAVLSYLCVYLIV